MRASIMTLLLLTSMATPAARGQAPIRAADLTDEHVQRAIEAIVGELYARKDSDRFWEPEKIPTGDSTRQAGGYTALTALALIAAGQSYQDPRLRDAIDHLAIQEFEGTYALALRACVWAKLPAKFMDSLAADAQWLHSGFSERSGGWDYVHEPNSSRKDNSIRQFGALALWESVKRGAKVEPQLWQRLEQGYLDMQLSDGGWNYLGEGPATGSMTAAGLATLFITQDVLHAQESVKIDSTRDARHQDAIERGLKWMDEYFSATENPGRNTHFYYYLWGVERAGLASGYKFFGGHDWYREGAAELIRRLCKWDASSRSFTIYATTAGDGRSSKIKTDDLAFALIFLSRGRAPVAINKLRWAGEGAWNNRPRDAANLTRWIGEKSESDLNWQIVDLNAAPHTWLDAPMLYLASHEPLPWTRGVEAEVARFVRDAREFIRKRGAGELPPDASPPTPPDIPAAAKLKQYIDRGGLVMAINESPSKNFANSVEQLGTLLYPQYQWRTLADDHWAYTIHEPVSRRPVLRGLSNGVRELMIVAPSGDLAESFQINDAKQSAHFQVLMNIYFYASEMNRPRPRLAPLAIAQGSAHPETPAATIVRAVYDGNWKPEPAALPTFAAWFDQTRHITIRIVDHPLVSIDTMEPRPALVTISGIDQHAFNDAQTSAMRRYLEAGGVILFETAGGIGTFVPSAEQMAASLFERPIEPLIAARIITGEGLKGGQNLSRAEYRPFSLQAFGAREIAPRLRGMSIRQGTQPQLLFSREDISHALLDQPRWGISGYSPGSARELMANIVQHALLP